MKINRMASEQMAPEWLEGTPVSEKSEIVNTEEVERISLLASDQVTESTLVREYDQIEKCAGNGSLYHYSSIWSDSTKKELREYAVICGMDMSKFRAVKEDELKTLVASVEEKERVITAAISEVVEEPTLKLDAFHLDEAANMEHMAEADWETVGKQSDLADRPSMTSGAIQPLRGGENYFETSDYIEPARGQNSITDPTAIETLAESEVEDTGARLRQENEDRAKQREVNHEEWEQGKIDAMSGNIIAGRSVFKTENMNAQPGLNTPSSQMGVYAKFSPDDIPEKTEGELIAGQNEERRQSIQGSSKEEHEFKLAKAQTRGISDTFADELKKHLK